MKYAAVLIRLLFLVLFLLIVASGKMMLWLILFAVSLAVATVFGRVYCGYACPMNTLMIPTEWVSRKFRLQTTKTPKWLKNGYFQWVTLAISLAAFLLLKRIMNMNFPILPFWLILSVLITIRYRPTVFHNLICPFGVLQGVFGRFARLSKKVDGTACIGCGLCVKSCPSNAITVAGEVGKAAIDGSLCHQCTNCREVCPKDAIRYQK